jgi:hypothetical protein
MIKGTFHGDSGEFPAVLHNDGTESGMASVNVEYEPGKFEWVHVEKDKLRSHFTPRGHKRTKAADNYLARVKRETAAFDKEAAKLRKEGEKKGDAVAPPQ